MRDTKENAIRNGSNRAKENPDLAELGRNIHS